MVRHGRAGDMKIVLTILATVTLLACSELDLPTLPQTPGPGPTLPQGPPLGPLGSRAWVWGLVVNDAGVCIAGASATVVRGQGLGQSAKQSTPCDAWAYDGGFVFRDLTPGVEMTIRASAPGYVSQELIVVPSLSGEALLFTPSLIP
jgi:hypothetical protein